MDEVATVEGFTAVVPSLYECARGGQGLREAVEAVFAQIDRLIEDGVSGIVLSDRGMNVDLAPIPSLLITAAVHHHLIRTKQRTKVGLVVETGDAREVHHCVCSSAMARPP